MVYEDNDEECSVCYQKMILPTVVPACGHKFCFLCIKGAASRTGENTCPKCRGEVSPTIFDRPKVTGVTLDMHDPESPSVNPAFARPISLGHHSKRPKADSDSDPAPSSKKVKPRNSHSQTSDEEEGVKVVTKDEEIKSSPDEEPESEPERFYWLYKQGNGGWWRFDPRLEKDIEAGREVTPDSTQIIICGHTYTLDFVQMVQYRKDTPSRRRDIKRVSDSEFKSMSEKGNIKGIAGVRVA